LIELKTEIEVDLGKEKAKSFQSLKAVWDFQGSK
jgi:hypothetical protein